MKVIKKLKTSRKHEAEKQSVTKNVTEALPEKQNINERERSLGSDCSELHIK